MNTVEPRTHICARSEPGLEGSNAILNAFVVDACDGVRISGRGGSGSHYLGRLAGGTIPFIRA